MKNIILSFMIILLAGCSDSPSTVDTPGSADTLNTVKAPASNSSNPWQGKYEFYLHGAEIGGVHTGWTYTVELNDKECFYTGEGYQMGFKYRCEPIITNDTLYLKYVGKFSKGKEELTTEPSSTRITRVNDKYYFASERLAEETPDKPTRYGYEIKKLDTH